MAVALMAFPWVNPFTHGPSPQVQPWVISMICAVALWLLCATGSTLPATRLLWPGAGLVAWAAMTHGSVPPEVTFLAAGLLLVAISASLAREPSLPELLQAGFLLAAATSAVLGLCQYLGWAFLFGPWINHADTGLAYANLRQTNQYATLCWIGLAVVLFGTLRLPVAMATGLAALLGVACAASVSRTGALELLTLAVAAAWWRGPGRRRRLLLCGLAAAAYVGAAFLLPSLLEILVGDAAGRRLWIRLAGGDTPSCSSRLVLWSNVLHLIAQHPFTGWGWGELDYAHYMTLYGDRPRFCEILDNAHNLPLHLAVELGIPAALLVCGGAIVWVWKQRPWRETAPLRQLAWAMLALVVLHSLLEYPLWYGPFQIALGICIGWLAVARPLHADGPPQRFRIVAAASMLLALMYAAWDYTRVSQIYLPPEARRAAWREDTLEHARRSWLFQGQARFADVTLATPTRANAAWMYQEATRALHYSPEPRVIERVIESATFLGRDDEAVLHLARYRAAFPQDYEAWRQRQQAPAR